MLELVYSDESYRLYRVKTMQKDKSGIPTPTRTKAIHPPGESVTSKNAKLRVPVAGVLGIPAVDD